MMDPDKPAKASAHDAQALQLHVLGPVQVRGPDGVELSLQPKRLALLVYLAVAKPRGAHRRDTLLALLWPEQNADSARGALRQALSGIRQTLPTGVLVTEGDDVGLDRRRMVCDVWAFEDAIDEAEPERAVQLYRAPFLNGFFLGDCPQFEQWAEGERDRLARSYRTVLEQSAARAVEQGDHLAAVTWWRRVSEQDPYSTRVAIRVMQALEAAGDRAGALQHADRHTARLRDDLSAEPAPDVVALADRLRGHPAQHPSLRSKARQGLAAVDSFPRFKEALPDRAQQLDRLKALLADRYRIERELGRGGMATVYLAEDLRNERPVAIKVFKPELAAMLGPDRFLREVKLTARLDHPHIVALHDSGEAGGLLYYVMPYVEGESLRDRLNRERQLPIDDAVQITRQVADALEFAHRHGVVHRDIKPENILLGAGHARVADFGIARAISAAAGDRLTETGIAVGTPEYMSPEQAGGEKELDGRSDVYALGCVLYEMLAGQPPFTGPTAGVVHQHLAVVPHSITNLRPAVPAEVAEALARALAKTPADRFATPNQFAEAMGWDGVATSGDVPRGLATIDAAVRLVSRVMQRPLVAWALAGVFGVTALGLGLALGGGDAVPADVVRFTIRVPAEQWLSHIFPRISRNGQMIVLLVQEGRNMRLVQRPLAAVSQRLVVDVPAGRRPRFAVSPDGAWVVYPASGKLWKVATSGNAAPIELAEASWGGADWAPGETILYTESDQSGLWMVSAAGGDARQLSARDTLRGELGHWWPQLLPDGRGILFTAYSTPIERARVEVLRPEAGERRVLVEGAIYGRYVATGHLLFVRGHTLFAVSFDVGRLEVRGHPVPVLEDLAVDPPAGVAGFDVSETGTLVYIRQSVWASRNRLVWVDRSGRVAPVLDRLASFASPRLSPDGRRLAVTLTDQNEDVWVYDVSRGVFTRLTSHRAQAFNPIWTADGRRVIYSAETPQYDIFWRAVDGSAPPETLLTAPPDKIPRSITPDGRFLLYSEYSPTADLWMMVLDGSREVRRLTESPYEETGPAVSPDGRWLAYVSNESGQHQVYVMAFPELGRRTQVSIGGGLEPVWTRSGEEILYRDGDRMLSVSFDPASGEVSRATELFVEPFAYAFPGPNFDVSADGERLLMVQTAAELLPREVEVVLNWFEELKAKVGG